MIVGIVKETFPDERRVALIPSAMAPLIKAGIEVLVEAGAGDAAGFDDDDYVARGAKIASTRDEVFRQAGIICQVRTFGANPREGTADLPLMKSGLTVIGLSDPFNNVADIQAMAQTGVRCFAMELMPRITRAQSMDALSSQATISGYQAVLMAAGALPRMFPMMMTAAGTIAAAKVFVIGAGVAGLQAIATAKRLGAVVHGYDVRPVVKEQVESLGARFVQIELDSRQAEGQGGYAKAMDEEFYRRQRELLARVVADSDVVITTAAVPGGKPPLLVTADMLRSMPAGGVVVDLAVRMRSDGASGNCELTQPDETVIVPSNEVKIFGPTNLPATVPQSASQLYAKNIASFLLHLCKDGEVKVNMEDEITSSTLLTEDGRIVNSRVPSGAAS